MTTQSAQDIVDHAMQYQKAKIAYSEALVVAIGELQNVPKTANNPYFKSKYAPLDAIIEATRPVLRKHGLAVMQQPLFMEGTAGVETTILHSGGYSTTTTLLLPLKDQSPQGVGSAITYARRYALAAVLGIASEDDDDGNISTGLAKKEEPRPAIAKVMDKSPSVRPAGNATATWRGVLPAQAKIAAQSNEGSPKKWTLYSVEFNDNGKKIEAMTFDEKLFLAASDFGANGTVVDAAVAPGKKDPSKWELVSLAPSDEKA
jgi:ERF superfamily